MSLLNPRITSSIALLLGGALPATALAQDDGPSGYSTDIELVRPMFSADGLLSVDSPKVLEAGTLRVGALLQYQNSPLRLIEFNEPQGSVVSHRHTLHLGLSYSPTKRLSTRVVLPVMAQWGGQIEDLRADGPGMGDLSGGLRWYAGSWDRFSAGFYGDLILPIGTRSNYMGETRPRVDFGTLLGLDFNEFELFGNLGVVLRQVVRTEQDFTLGNELSVKLGGRYAVMPDNKLSVVGEIITRGGFSNFLGGGAENSMEWLAGLQTQPNDTFRIDVGIGRGITEGYGTTGVRLYAGLTFLRIPKKENPDDELDLEFTELPDDEPDVDVPAPMVVAVRTPPPEPPRLWKPGERARQEGKRIVIREPIQFELNTARILPESIPTLHAVAKILSENATIGHLVIEGHASEEGTFAWNYKLSKMRADAIWEELFKVGVYPGRMSTRGMGEVVPKQSGTDEEELAVNRRVEFQIVKQYAPGEEIPDYDPEAKVPWDGSVVPITSPPKPEAPAPEAVPGRPGAPTPPGEASPPAEATPPTDAPATPELSPDRFQVDEDDIEVEGVELRQLTPGAPEGTPAPGTAEPGAPAPAPATGAADSPRWGLHDQGAPPEPAAPTPSPEATAPEAPAPDPATKPKWGVWEPAAPAEDKPEPTPPADEDAP